MNGWGSTRILRSALSSSWRNAPRRWRRPLHEVGGFSSASYSQFVAVLSLAPASESAFTRTATGLAPVVDGVLGTFDPTLLLNDLYTVRLTVTDRAGNTAAREVVYQVARDVKVGLFTLAFQVSRSRWPACRSPSPGSTTAGTSGWGTLGWGGGWTSRPSASAPTACRGCGGVIPGIVPTYVLVPTDGPYGERDVRRRKPGPGPRRWSG